MENNFCPNNLFCLFYKGKMQEKPKLTELYKKKYCLGNYNECARWIVFKNLGKESVPSALYPNQKDKAEKIVNESLSKQL